MTNRVSSRHDLYRLLAHMTPERQRGVYRFATLAHDRPFNPANCVCTMREPEGISLVAESSNLPEDADVSDYRAAWITLRIHSALDAIGLTAAVSTALANVGISCNIIAGTRHDHLFVPDCDADRAMGCLRDLQQESQSIDHLSYQ